MFDLNLKTTYFTKLESIYIDRILPFAYALSWAGRDNFIIYPTASTCWTSCHLFLFICWFFYFIRVWHKRATGRISTNPYPNPNNYYPLFNLPNPTHVQWIISFVLDFIHTQSIICTLPISSFEVGVDLNMDNG
jgi:hypothetical protein